MYRLTHTDIIIKYEDNGYISFIPFDEKNSDYQKYLDWLGKGNIPQDAEPLPEPEILTPLQKLEKAGLTVDELKQLLGI